MDEAVVNLIGTVGVCIFILVAYAIYYSTPRLCSCAHCGREIGIKEKKRHFIKVKGVQHVVCNRCYLKGNTTPSLNVLREQNHQELNTTHLNPNYRSPDPNTYCYCCEKHIKGRMQKHVFQVEGRVRYLCAYCARAVNKDTKFVIDINGLITPDFLIENNISAANFDELAQKYGSKINVKEDLDSTQWDEFIKVATDFSSWKEMEEAALTKAKENHIASTIEKVKQSKASKNS